MTAPRSYGSFGASEHHPGEIDGVRELFARNEQRVVGSLDPDRGRVIAMYHGTEVGNMVAVSCDPLLLNWEKVTGEAVMPGASPSCEKGQQQSYTDTTAYQFDHYSSPVATILTPAPNAIMCNYCPHNRV